MHRDGVTHTALVELLARNAEERMVCFCAFRSNLRMACTSELLSHSLLALGDSTTPDALDE